jgi:hypothetical protein
MDPTDDDRAKFASGILYAFATSKDSRLRYGAGKRKEMQAALDSGQKVSGYRAEWILRSVEDVLRVLIKSADRFNSTYFHDYISVDDMRDVLVSTINRLDKTSSKTNKD